MSPPVSLCPADAAMALAWTLGASYIVCIVVGFGYLAVSFLLGHVGGDHGGIGHADGGHGLDAHDLHDVGTHDYHGHAAEGKLVAQGGQHGQGAYVGPWSPLVLATFVFFFGAAGYLFSGGALADWGYYSLLPAAASGFVLAAMAVWTLNTVFIKTEGSSEPGRRELIGRQATVTVPIHPGGMGQVSYIARGTKFTAPARILGEQAADRNTLVTITRIDGGTFVVAAEPAGQS